MVDEIVYGLNHVDTYFQSLRYIACGGILEQKYIIREVRRRVNENLSDGFRGTEIRQARLGNQAGLLGAAWLASNLIPCRAEPDEARPCGASDIRMPEWVGKNKVK